MGNPTNDERIIKILFLKYGEFYFLNRWKMFNNQFNAYQLPLSRRDFDYFLFH